jgi:hypothetical protein
VFFWIPAFAAMPPFAAIYIAANFFFLSSHQGLINLTFES